MKPFTSKHSIAAGSPVHMGGSGKSPLYQDKRSGNLPKQVDENPTSRLYREGSVIRERATGNVVIGGRYDDTGKYVPRTAAQRRPIASNKTTEERKVNKPEQKTKTEVVTKPRDIRSNKDKKQAAVDTKKAQSAKTQAEMLSRRAEKKKIKASKNT